MARDEGFAVADVATAKHTDPKFRRLWRTLNDEAAMNSACVLHEAVTLASWQQGHRVRAEEAAPFWQSDVAAAVDNLKSVGLLDRHGMLPKHAWESWYLPAYERREQRREAGRIGGKRSGETRGSEGGAPPNGRSSDASSGAPAPLNPSVPSVPTVRSVPTGPSVPALRAVGSHGVKDTSKERNEAVARALAKLNDPTASEDVKNAARYALERLGAA